MERASSSTDVPSRLAALWELPGLLNWNLLPVAAVGVNNRLLVKKLWCEGRLGCEVFILLVVI